jgi:hypothetical protein
MKNIHVLPTDKPSRLFKFANELHLDTIPKDYYKKYNINITSDEEIKEGDKDFYIIANDRDKTWINRIEKVIECKIDPKHGKVLILSSGFIYIDEGCKIILTTDLDLIKDGVQAIDDTFLEWFIKNPSCEFVETLKFADSITTYVYKIIIPQEEPKQIKCYCGHTTYCDCSPLDEAPEEAAEKEFPLIDTEWCRTGACKEENLHLLGHRKSFIKGAKWQAEKMYSEEEVLDLLAKFRRENRGKDSIPFKDIQEWFKKFKKK